MSLCFHHSFNYLIEDKGKMKNLLEFFNEFTRKLGVGITVAK